MSPLAFLFYLRSNSWNNLNSAGSGPNNSHCASRGVVTFLPLGRMERIALEIFLPFELRSFRHMELSYPRHQRIGNDFLRKEVRDTIYHRFSPQTIVVFVLDYKIRLDIGPYETCFKSAKINF